MAVYTNKILRLKFQSWWPELEFGAKFCNGIVMCNSYADFWVKFEALIWKKNLSPTLTPDCLS